MITPHELGEEQWNWSTVREYGKKLTRRNADGVLTQLGLYRFRYRPNIQIGQAGGMQYDRFVNPTASRWNTPEVIAALSFIQGAIVEDGTALYRFDNTFRFWNGTSGINLIDGPGIIGPYLSNVDFNWDIAPQPMGPANNGSEVRPAIGLQISAQSRHPEIVWEWVNFIATRQEAITRFAQITGRLPALLEVAQQYGRYVPVAPKHWEVFHEVSLNPHSFPSYVVPDDRVGRAENEILNRVWAGEMSVPAAVQMIDEMVNALLQSGSAH